MPEIVNIDQENALSRDLTEVLMGLLGEVSWLRNWQVATEIGLWDVVASGPVPGGDQAGLLVECKGASFAPSQFSSLVGRQRPFGKAFNAVEVLAMPRVSPRMADLCRQHGWSWFDLAGNCRIEIPGVLLIDRSGREPVALPPREANLGTPEAGRVLRALLAPENAGKRWTQREMVAHFAKSEPPVPAPSLALVNKVVQHLRDQALVEPLESRGFRVSDFERLLQAWRQAYRFDRHRRRSYFTLLHSKQILERLDSLDLGRDRLALASFSAADWQAPAVRQPRIWLYLRPEAEHDFAVALEAKQVDSGENLVVLLADDPGVLYSLDKGYARMACTNPVQTYVDLTHTGGRGEEAAEAILIQRLRPAWRES